MLNIYRASAGSGKTYRLTKDYIRLLFSAYERERTHRRVLAVTFTNKATEEMKSRVLNELYKLAQGEKSDYRNDLMQEFHLAEQMVNNRAKKILNRILQDYSAFSISTIDAFFQQILRSFAREIGINGGYNLELNTDETLDSAVDTLFQDLSKEENKQLLQWMTKFAEEKVELAESWNIRKNILELGREIFKENYQFKADETNKKLHDKDFLTSYITNIRKEKTEFETRVISKATKALNILDTNGLKPEDFNRSLMHKTLDKIKSKEFEFSGTFRKYSEDVSNCYAKTKPQAIKTAIETAYSLGLGDVLKELVELLTEDIIRYHTADLILKHLNTLGVLSDLAMYIQLFTSEQNSMLISDTNMLLSKIIEDSDTPFVYEKTGINVDHFMIDEFQDTSVLQWRNFKPLIQESLSFDKENMLVGDVKQSIYRWRNSDWKLLQEQVKDDFRDEQLKNQVLDTNWRSDKNIVEFNNAFFHSAATLLQDKFNEDVAPMLENYPNLEKLTEKISGAYTDVNQLISPKAKSGHVQFEFIPNDGKKEDWQAESLLRIPKTIEHLIDNGYKPADIAFLVRTKEQASHLINFLFQYKNSPEARKDISYNVIGNEGLTLTSSQSVSFIISLLKLLENPKNDIQRAILNYEYLRGKKKLSNDEAIKLALTSQPEKFEGISIHFTQDENSLLKEMKHLPFYEQIESIIHTFKLIEWFPEAVFLQAFQDMIFRFVNIRSADLNSFLIWWEKNKDKQYISTPENQDAFRVMTIHKSKGLDFKAVIIPFCDWALDSNKNRQLIWLQTDEAPFSELPLIPISFSSKLSNTVFASQYYEELMHQYVDSLNIAYVAFTRAKHELICFIPTPKEKSKKEKSELQTISNLSDIIFNYAMSQEGNLSQNEQGIIFEQGAPTIAELIDKATKATNKMEDYPISPINNRLKIKSLLAEEWKTDKTIDENPLNFGVIMHKILQNLTQKDDENRVIQELITAGEISEKESEFIKATLLKFWELPHIENWFFGAGKVLNEATILLPEGEHYRPDRVILNKNKAIVTDYKFGSEKRNSYTLQIKRYGEILKKMNYEPELYLVYVTLSEVQNV